MHRLIRAFVPYRFVVWASGEMLGSLDQAVTRTQRSLERAENLLRVSRAGASPARISLREEAVEKATRARDKAVRQRDDLFELRTQMIAKRGRR